MMCLLVILRSMFDDCVCFVGDIDLIDKFLSVLKYKQGAQDAKKAKLYARIGKEVVSA